ncbi:MAG: hypothetical protein O7D31_10870, partial [Alphaproteobacteria bacterium]|nr:hypothetical protein [Alphaproteobacteria bacterium]
MTDDLRSRGIQALGKLITTGSQEALGELKAWGRECVSAYPGLGDLGPIPPDERETAEGLVQQLAPDFTITHPSTYWLDAETIEATAVTNAVRLNRMQPPNVKRKSKAGRKPIDDNEIEAAIEKAVEKQSKPNKHKALIEVIDRMNLDPQEFER